MQRRETGFAGLASALLLAGSLGFAAAPAQGAAINVTGFTNGCFGAACPPGVGAAPPYSSTTLGGLTYWNSSFSVFTNPVTGTVGVGGAPNPPNNFNNFGSFTLDGTNFDYQGQEFQLRISFTAPPGISPNGNVFEATIAGVITGVPGQGIDLDFDNAPVFFTWEGGSGSVRVNDVSLNVGMDPTMGQNASVTGSITIAVPEPATLGLFGAGLLGLGAVMRRRRAV